MRRWRKAPHPSRVTRLQPTRPQPSPSISPSRLLGSLPHLLAASSSSSGRLVAPMTSTRRSTLPGSQPSICTNISVLSRRLASCSPSHHEQNASRSVRDRSGDVRQALFNRVVDRAYNGNMLGVNEAQAGLAWWIMAD